MGLACCLAIGLRPTELPRHSASTTKHRCIIGFAIACRHHRHGLSNFASSQVLQTQNGMVLNRGVDKTHRRPCACDILSLRELHTQMRPSDSAKTGRLRRGCRVGVGQSQEGLEERKSLRRVENTQQVSRRRGREGGAGPKLGRRGTGGNWRAYMSKRELSTWPCASSAAARRTARAAAGAGARRTGRPGRRPAE